MKWNRVKSWTLCAAILTVMIATGCSSSDFLNPGNFTVEFPNTTAESTDFDCIMMDFARYTVRPLDGFCSDDSDNAGEPCGVDLECINGECEGTTTEDPAADEVVGNLGIAVVIEPLSFVSFTGKGCNQLEPSQPFVTVPPIIVSSQSYSVFELTLGNFKLIADDGSLLACNGTGNIALAYTKEQLTFKINSERANTVTLVLDVEAALPFLGNEPTPSCTNLFANITDIISIVAE